MFEIRNIDNLYLAKDVELYKPKARECACIYKIRIFFLQLFGMTVSVKNANKIYHIKKSSLKKYLVSQGSPKIIKNFHDELNRVCAVITLQSAIHTRRVQKENENKTKKIIKIQALFRGNRARKKMIRIWSAMIIQNAYRQHLKRKVATKSIKNDKSIASKIIDASKQFAHMMNRSPTRTQMKTGWFFLRSIPPATSLAILSYNKAKNSEYKASFHAAAAALFLPVAAAAHTAVHFIKPI